MKEIKLKELHLLNFKGARDMHVSFDPVNTVISGDNGTGKTTIADAFHWLLFGKDSFDREKFDYKTLDTNSNIIPRLPHEVSGILLVNGKEICLTRRIVEKWVRNTGKETEEFQGNETERLYNDIPCNEKEFDAKIAEICSQTTFKLITNPDFFCRQKNNVQKDALLKLAGEIKDSDVAGGNKDFEEFLNLVSGKTFAEFKKEINAKKSKIKDELIDKPSRIDEHKRKMPADENWDELQSQLNAKEIELEAMEEHVMDIAKRNEAADAVLRETYAEISRLRKRISERESEINHEANKEYEAELGEWNKLHQLAITYKTDIAAYEREIEAKQKDVDEWEEGKKKLLADYATIIKSINEINKRVINFTDDDFRCPTCGRVFEEDGIAAKQIELREKFEERKQRDLEVQLSLKQANIREGQALAAKIIDRQEQIADFKARAEKISAKKTEIEAMPLFNKELRRADASLLIASDLEIKSLNNRISDLQGSIQSSVEKSDISTIINDRKRIVFDIDSLKSALSKRGDIAEANARIAQLESEYKELSAELNRLKRMEFIMEEFSKAKNKVIEERINSLFKIVKFRWTAQQVNGAEKETCEATVNGVPYSVLNNAGQIAAGLDIINAICTSQQICAPIFIDNAESINELPETIGQKILLQVSADPVLKITHNTKPQGILF